MSEDRFLSRWARRKAAARSGTDPQPATDLSGAAPAASPTDRRALPADAGIVQGAPSQPSPVPADLPLPEIESLRPESDFRPFMQSGIDATTRNAAMKKLFVDPRFNVMDGLDTYIGDYNTPDPMPDSMLRALNQSRVLGLFADAVDDAVPARSTDSIAATASDAASIAPRPAAIESIDAEPAGLASMAARPAGVASMADAAVSPARPAEPTGHD